MLKKKQTTNVVWNLAPKEFKKSQVEQSGLRKKKVKRKVQGVSQSQTAALHRHQEEEETNNSKQVQIEQTYEKH